MTAPAVTRPAARTTKAAKPVVKMYVRPVNTTVGQYTCSSQSYGDWLLYSVDAKQGTCDCEGFSKWGRTCKHLRLVTAIWQSVMAYRAQSEREAKLAAARTSFASLQDAFE